MTEKEKMLGGEIYSAVDAKLIAELQATREVLYEYNSLHPSEILQMKEILKELLGHVGDDCFIGPNVSIYTACHSTDPVARNSRREWAEPVTIGNNVWIGGSVTILPGVTIGDNVTVGAGSVVVSDIPSDTIAVGNPCKVISHLTNLPCKV